VNKRWQIGFWLAGLGILLGWSFIWHLPASWVLPKVLQTEAASKVPFLADLPLQANNFQGTWHQGKAVLYESRQQFPQMQLAWHLDTIFLGQPSLKLQLVDFYRPSQKLEIQGQVSLWQSHFLLQAAKARLTLSTLARWLKLAPANLNLPPEMLNVLATSEGTLLWHQLTFEMPLQMTEQAEAQNSSFNFWPNNLQAKGTLVGLNLLQMIKLSKLHFELTQTKSGAIHFAFYSTQKGQKAKNGWKLIGEGSLQPQAGRAPRLRYRIEVNSQPNTPLPDWTMMFMKQITPNKAVLELK